VTPPAVGGRGEAQSGAFYPHHRGVGAGQDDSVDADLVVVLLVHRAPGAEGGVGDHVEQDRPIVPRFGELFEVEPPGLFGVGRRNDLALVDWGVGEVAGGHGAD
jgi:hypothetical protein